jgi:hypothetical protein
MGDPPAYELNDATYPQRERQYVAKWYVGNHVPEPHYKMSQPRSPLYNSSTQWNPHTSQAYENNKRISDVRQEIRHYKHQYTE